MAEKKANILTRGVKKSVQDDPDLVQLFDEETKERLQLMLKEKTPTSVSSARNIQLSVSSSSRKSSFVNLRQQLESCVWVQCDNTECFKWRMVKEGELAGVTEDTKWFCSMNRNKEFASCDIPEEDTEWYDRAAKRVGLCYVKTPITEGSLVWAKISGYCKWPGVVTKDPCNQLHCLRGMDNEPRWYHVEFLGGSHTHSWVRAASVKLYILHSSPVGHTVRKKLKGRGGIRRRKKSKLFSSVVVIKQPEKTEYKNGLSVDEACVEARRLLDLSNTERLSRCSYLSTGPQNITQDNNTVREDVYRFQETRNKVFDFGVKHKDDPKGLPTQHVKDKHGRKEKAQRESVLSPPGSEQPNLDALEMKFTDSLLDHTKEEKLVLDVQMYQRNERAFEHDVLRFMRRNNVKFRGAPKWQNTSISLFQLFLAVHERGGYNKVCSNRGGWVQVYNELTEFNQNSGNCAKNYYKRNLYPYELYIKGKDFTSVLPSNKRKRRKTSQGPSTEVDKNIPKCPNIQTNSLEDYLEREWVNLDTCLENSSLASEDGSVDLMELLGDLENTGNLCCLEDDVEMNKAKLGIDITFYDQSPVRPKKDSHREADTASEFGYGLIQVTAANPQEVPTLSGSSHSCSHDDQILHEMRALQNDIDLVAGEIDFY